MTDRAATDDQPPRTPWDQSRTALSCGFDPDSVSLRSARRRTGDAGLGRAVVVPVYLRRAARGATEPSLTGLLVRLAPQGVVTLPPGTLRIELGDPDRFWLAVHRASSQHLALVRRDGWVQVTVAVDDTRQQGAGGTSMHLVLRDSDWALLDAALALRHPASTPQDAPVERVLSRFIGRLDGLDGTSAEGLWGRLTLEVVSVRQPGRLADSRSLRWRASWGVGGFGAGSGGRAEGWAGSPTLLALKQQQVDIEGRTFRVRTLPDWEREQAAHDLGMPPLRLLAWPVAPLAALVALFDDSVPAPPPTGDVQAPQDSPTPVTTRGPQDSRWPPDHDQAHREHRHQD